MGNAVLDNALSFIACMAAAVPTGFAFGCGDPAPRRGAAALATTVVGLACGLVLYFARPIGMTDPPSRDIFILIATFFGIVGAVAEWTAARRSRTDALVPADDDPA